MHNSALLNGNAQGGPSHEQDLHASYHADFMNLDDNLFGLDSESRDLIFGRNGMDDNSNIANQHYEPSPMQTDSNDLNNILAQMPTPVSNDLRASTSNAFMSPLQVDQHGYDRINGVQYQSHGNDEMFFTPLLSPAVTPMDIMRLHENDSMGSSMDPVYFSPLTSPALERFPHSQNDPRRSQSMVALPNNPSSRRAADNMADVQRSVRRAPYHSPVARAVNNRKRNSITHLNLNANGSQSEQSSDSVSPEPLPSSSMPPPPPRNTSSTKLSEKASASGRHRQKRTAGEVAPATPSSFLNLTLQHSDAQQAGHGHAESTVTFDPNASTDTSPATVKSASSTPTFGPTNVGASSPSFISIPASYDPNSMVTTPTLSATGLRRPQLKQNSRAQSRSSSSSPAFKPIISPNLKPLLPGGTPTEVANTLASKSNYQNILEGKHNQLGLSYPKELSSGIESRRTSHKVAEQARRSRINNAIDQLGTMLPGETDGISKAITVEKAIDYIKNLEDQLAKAKAQLEEKQK